LGIAAISYDNVEILQDFSERHGIRFALLADPDSAVIDAFGIRNTMVEKGSFGDGVPFPGTYIVDADGVVTEKIFEKSYRQRQSAETILLKTFGVGGGRRTEVESPQFKLAAYQSEDKLYPGNRFLITVEIELPDKMHLYAPGADPYRAVDLKLIDNPMLEENALKLPVPENIYLPVIEQEVPVYQNSVRLHREVTLSPRYRESSITVATELSYQTCDDEVCFPPAKMPLQFELEVAGFDTQRVAKELQHNPAK